MIRVQVVVTDANILINLIHIGGLSILGSLPQFEFVVPEEVVAEVLNPEEAASLQAAFDANHVTRATEWDTEEVAWRRGAGGRTSRASEWWLEAWL